MAREDHAHMTPADDAPAGGDEGSSSDDNVDEAATAAAAAGDGGGAAAAALGALRVALLNNATLRVQLEEDLGGADCTDGTAVYAVFCAAERSGLAAEAAAAMTSHATRTTTSNRHPQPEQHPHSHHGAGGGRGGARSGRFFRAYHKHIAYHRHASRRRMLTRLWRLAEAAEHGERGPPIGNA